MHCDPGSGPRTGARTPAVPARSPRLRPRGAPRELGGRAPLARTPLHPERGGRARPGPGMLTQPGRSLTSPARHAMLSPAAARGEARLPCSRAASSRGPCGPRRPRQRNRGDARVDEPGEVGAGGRTPGSPAPRARLTQTGRNLFCPRRAQAASRSPAGGQGRAGRAPGTCGQGGGPRNPRARPEVPAFCAASAPRPARLGAQGCAGPGGAGSGGPRMPAARARRPAGPRLIGTARPLPSVTPGPGSGRARARHGLVHVGRRTTDRPLLGGARRSQHMVGGAPPRPAETGCSRYRISDRQRRGAGRGRPHAHGSARAQAAGRGAGARPGAQARGAGGGPGARGSPARNQLAIGWGPRPSRG